MTQIMCRFPVIESLIAVLYRGIESSQKIGTEEYVKCADGLDCEWSGRPVVFVWSVNILWQGNLSSDFFFLELEAAEALPP